MLVLFRKVLIIAIVISLRRERSGKRGRPLRTGGEDSHAASQKSARAQHPFGSALPI